jgi:hypothetical protein
MGSGACSLKDERPGCRSFLGLRTTGSEEGRSASLNVRLFDDDERSRGDHARSVSCDAALYPVAVAVIAAPSSTGCTLSCNGFWPIIGSTARGQTGAPGTSVERSQAGQNGGGALSRLQLDPPGGYGLPWMPYPSIRAEGAAVAHTVLPWVSKACRP